MRSREVRAHVCFSLAESRSVMSDSLRPHGLYSPHGLNSPGQNLGVGSLSLLLGIFLTQESNQGLLHCRRILYQLATREALQSGSGGLKKKKFLDLDTIDIWGWIILIKGFSGGTHSKESTCQCRRLKRLELWVQSPG